MGPCFDAHPNQRRSLAAILVAATAALALGGCGSDEDGEGGDSVNAEPTASAPANPGESVDGNNGQNGENEQPTSAPVELTVERYGTDGEELTRAYMTQFNDWMTANATLESLNGWETTETLESYIAKINQPVDDEYIDTLFVSDWQQRPQLKKAVEDYIDGHANGVQINLMTTESYNEEDLEPYRYGWDLSDVDVQSESEKEIIVSYRWEGWDNSDMNRGDVISSDGSFDGATGGATVTWVDEDGAWKIADHKHYGG